MSAVLPKPPTNHPGREIVFRSATLCIHLKHLRYITDLETAADDCGRGIAQVSRDIRVDMWLPYGFERD